MRTNAICPISINKIDENVARLNGLFTVVLLSVYFITGNLLPVIFLLYDFLVRGAEKSKYSLLAILSKRIIKLFHIKSKPINAGPKIFAARIGVLFSVAIIIFNVFALNNSALVSAIIFGLCAFLEAAFNFCVACKIYPFVYHLMFHINPEKQNF